MELADRDGEIKPFLDHVAQSVLHHQFDCAARMRPSRTGTRFDNSMPDETGSATRTWPIGDDLYWPRQVHALPQLKDRSRASVMFGSVIGH
jgi:hypothetical protein